LSRSDSGVLYEYDAALLRGLAGRAAGVDEAGRGPLAGPVVAAAVILDPGDRIEGIDDSKRVPEKKREVLYEQIAVRAAAWAVGSASVEEIDTLNILAASLLAMARALEKLGTAWSVALIDGNRPVPSLDPKRQITIVGGDARSASIAAASIMAKVTRDRIMRQYHVCYPCYAFDAHKGYGTEEHRRRIAEHGLCPLHRKSFCGKLRGSAGGVPRLHTEGIYAH
jgi:ribonuclease HII